MLHVELFAPPVGNMLASCEVRLLAAPLTRDSQECGCTPVCWVQHHFCGVAPSPEHLPHLPQARGPVLLSHSSHHWPFAFTGAGLRSPLRGTPPRLLRGGQPHADLQGTLPRLVRASAAPCSPSPSSASLPAPPLGLCRGRQGRGGPSTGLDKTIRPTSLCHHLFPF